MLWMYGRVEGQEGIRFLFPLTSEQKQSILLTDTKAEVKNSLGMFFQ